MTPEKQLEHAYKIAAAILNNCGWTDGNTSVKWLDEYLNSKSEICKSVPGLASAAALADDARAQLLKKSTGGAAPAIKRIIKNVGGARPDYNGWWKDNEGRACICDGFRAVRLNSDIKGIEEIPAPALDLNRAMQKDMNGEYITLPLPTVPELKAEIARQKAEGVKKGAGMHGVVWDFGEEYQQVDAVFLLDMLLIFPDARQVQTVGRMSSPLYFETKRGDGMLLPVRKTYRKVA